MFSAKSKILNLTNFGKHSIYITSMHTYTDEKEI